MKGFREFYVWILNAKLFMGLYYSAVMMIVGMMYFIQKIYAMDLKVLCTAFIPSVLVAMLQLYLLGNRCDYSKGLFFLKSTSWLIMSTALFGIVAYVFSWFEGLSNMNYIVLAIVLGIGFLFMLLGKKYEQELSGEKTD